MARKKTAYGEGTWFAVPLEDRGHALGLVARKGKGGILLGFFFGPCRSSLPQDVDPLLLSPADAILVCRFGDLGLLRGEWPIIADTDEWCRETWTATCFGHIDLVNPAQAWCRRYADDDPGDFVEEVPISPEDARHLPEDALFGYSAVEIMLNQLID